MSVAKDDAYLRLIAGEGAGYPRGRRHGSFSTLVKICRALVRLSSCALLIGAAMISVAVIVKVVDLGLDRIHY